MKMYRLIILVLCFFLLTGCTFAKEIASFVKEMCGSTLNVTVEPQCTEYNYVEQTAVDDWRNQHYQDQEETVWLNSGLGINESYRIYTLYCGRFHSDSDRLSKHVADLLVYLNEETGKAECVYECVDMNRIVYGTQDLVIVFNAEENAFQYISVENNQVLQEVKADLKLKANRYRIIINPDQGIANVIHINIMNNEETEVLTLSLEMDVNETPTTVAPVDEVSSEPSVVSKIESKSDEVSSKVSETAVKENQYKKEYKDWLAEQREGFELLLHAPKNQKTLTKKQIEQIFYVDLPEKYTMKDYTCTAEKGETDRPEYSFTLIMDEQGLNQLITSPKMNEYHEMKSKDIMDYIISPSKVERSFGKGESLLYLTETGLVRYKHVDTLGIFVLKKKVDDKYQVYFHF